MLSRFLGFLVLALSGILSLGAYDSFVQKHLSTPTELVLPLFHLVAGFGLIRSKSWARYLTFFISGFYILLGILTFKHILSPSALIPADPLIRFLPTAFFRWNLSIISAAVFFVLPVLLMLYLSLNSTASRFEPWLQERFIWSAPFLVILAASFVFSYGFLTAPRLSYFFVQEETRHVLGFWMPPLYAQILRYIEFFLPLILALGLATGGFIIWSLTFVEVLLYWLPFLWNGLPPAELHSFKFLFFGFGWVFVGAVLLIHVRFFWNQRAWLEKRVAPKPESKGLIGEGLKPVGDSFPTAKKSWLMQHIVRRKWLYLFLIVDSIAAAIYFGREDWSLLPTKKTHSQFSLQKPSFRFEGSSIDSQGTYAIIQGKIVQIGAIVNGYRIEAIEAHRVLVSKEGKHYWLDEKGSLKEI